MLANETMKALECCYELDTWCSPENQNKCPLYGYEAEHCDKYLLKAARELIDHQKECLKKKDIEIDILIRKKEALKDEVSDLRAEVEAFKKSVREHAEMLAERDVQIKMLQKENEAFAPLGKMYSEIKSDARKEFADEFLEKLNQENDLYVRCAKNLLSEDFQRGYEEKNDDVVKIVRHLLKEVETDEE